MVAPASKQGKREFCIALFNRELNDNNCCPGNYDVDYHNGWFYWAYGNHDQQKAQRPDLTAEAERLMKAGVTVYYSTQYNSYVFKK